VTPDAPVLKQALEEAGHPPSLTSEQARRLVEECLAEQGNTLPPHERIGNLAILPQPLSVSAGELTAAHKLRRRQIEENYAETIDSLYTASPPTPKSMEVNANPSNGGTS